MDPEDFTMVVNKLVCHTQDCENQGVSIQVEMPTVAGAICGVCGQRITDITAVAS